MTKENWGITVALIGPDGSGKSTISARLAEEIPVDLKRIYMGVSQESSNVMLPTTWLVKKAKEIRSDAPVEASAPATPPADGNDRSMPSTGTGIREAARIANLMAEEWFRLLVARYHQARGRLVVFDRHFLADYYFHHVSPPEGKQLSLAARFHGWQLTKLFPKPDLVLALDADPKILMERKQEDPQQFLERRRAEYAHLPEIYPNLAQVDVGRPLDDVMEDVLRHVRAAATSPTPTSPSPTSPTSPTNGQP